MKNYLLTILILFFCNSIYAGQTAAKTDTNQIKKNLISFTRLSYKRTETDSLVAFCGFPFYSKGWRGDKTWRSAKELQQELKAILMRSRFRQTNYTVQSLYQINNVKHPLLKNKTYTCFQMIVHLPAIGEGENGSDVKTTFFVEKKKPYKIIGVTNEDIP